MSRWIYLLSFWAAAANGVLLGYLVFTASPVWPAVVSAIAATSSLVLLALSTRQSQSSDASLVEPPSPRIPPESPSSVIGAEDLESRRADEPLENKPWLKLVEECVDLYEEVERLQPSLDVSGVEFADHCRYRLLEILERSGVSILAEAATFDRRRHQAESTGESPHDGAAIEAILSPGFAVGRRVFRRARVRLAEPLLPTPEPLP